MLAAFEIRQRLDDDQPEDDPAKRSMYGEILRRCAEADQRLDAQVAAFDQLRDLEAQAPTYIEGLATRLAAVSGALPAAEAAWTELRGRYAATATEPVAENVERAGALLAAADTEITQARTELTGAGPAVAVVSGRAAEDALTQAQTLLDAIPRRATELTDAAAGIPAARAALEQDLAEARTMGDDLAAAVARTDAALTAATRSADSDPIAALRLLDDAGTALDQAMDAARAGRDRARRAAAALEQAQLTARSAVAAAEDFVTTRRGAVGAQARTRLAEARRHLARTDDPDPVVALSEAQQADTLAQEALRLARQDVDRWSAPTGGGSSGLGIDLGSLILGGILSGGGGGGHRGGFPGGFPGGGSGGFSPGSFGGSATRGRRGSGGRF
jgi:hypothetical protein